MEEDDAAVGGLIGGIEGSPECETIVAAYAHRLSASSPQPGLAGEQSGTVLTAAGLVVVAGDRETVGCRPTSRKTLEDDEHREEDRGHDDEDDDKCGP